MKKKLLSLIVLLIGVVFIILGIVVPNTMFKNKITYEYEKQLAGFDDKFSITITAGKQYDINSVDLHFETKFSNDEDLEITIDGSVVEETKEDNQYIYTFEVVIRDDTIRSIISGVDELTLNTPSGEIEVEYDQFNLNSGHIAIRIIFFLLAVVAIVISIALFFIHKGNDKYIASVKAEMREKYPEVDISSMSDDEIIVKLENLKANQAKQGFLEGLSNIINPKKQYATCEYCGTQNDIENIKCQACGGKLEKK